jgi:hypothetical protein
MLVYLAVSYSFLINYNILLHACLYYTNTYPKTSLRYLFLSISFMQFQVSFPIV